MDTGAQLEIIDHQVIDNWHPHADLIRNEALKMPFDVSGNYPGLRTEPYTLLRDTAYNFLRGIGYFIQHWPYEYNGAFQICTAGASTWVHSDATGWAAVWFLTPGDMCPEGHGTAFYRHKETGYLIRFGRQDPPQDEFEKILFIEGFFNRLLIYDARYFHASSIAGFGDSIETGRLTATFFWS